MEADEMLDRVRALFLECAAADPDRREELLAAESDGAVRAEVQGLLGHHDRPRAILAAEDPVLGDAPAPTQRRRLPKQIGPYRVLGLLGSGAMSVVYEAEQERPSRRVALKVLQPALAASTAAKRLLQEAEIIARLQHVGIAQVYGSGMTQDFGFGEMPYFAMERIHGQSLTGYARQRGLSVEQRCELVADICDAVHHAHERGVIHRDLKPANILVTDQGVAKVLDFGIARSTDAAGGLATLQTNTGQLLGTLPYMSPEQLSGSPSMDGRVDVYALGVMTYELLAGELPLPLDGLGLTEAVTVVRDQDPTSLGALNRRFRGDLETVVQKALAKEPDRRYLSAADLAADLRRFLRSEPIVARPQTAFYQIRKFTRRNRAIVGGVLTTMLMLLLGVVGMAVYADRNRVLANSESQLRGEAEAARDELRNALYRAEMVRAGNALDNPSGERSIGELISHWLPEAQSTDRRGWEWWFLNAYSRGAELDVPIGQFGDSLNMAWLPTGILTSGTNAGVGAAGRAAIWSDEDGRLVAEHVDWRRWPAVDADRRHIVVPVNGGLSLRTIDDNAELARFAAIWPNGVAIHPDGSELAVTCTRPRTDDERQILVFDIATQEVIARPLPGVRFMRPIEYSADGQLLAVSSEGPNRVTVFKTADWSVRQVVDWPTFPQTLAWHPTRPLLAVGDRSGAVSVLDGNTGELRAEIGVSKRMVHSVAWDPAGAQIAFGGDGHTVWVWDVDSDRTTRLGGHDKMVRDCIWNPAGTRVASTGSDGRLKVWNVSRPAPMRVLPESGAAFGRGVALAYRPDGMLACDLGGATVVVHPDSGELLERVVGRHVTWNHDGSLVAVRRGRRVVVERGDPNADGSGVVVSRDFDAGGWARLSWHPSDNRLAIGCRQSAYFWNPLGPAEEPVAWQDPGGLHHLRWDGDGKWLWLVGWDNSLIRVDPATGLAERKFDIGRCNAVIPDPQSPRFLAAGKPRQLRLFDPRNGAITASWESLAGQVLSAAWSPDGRRIATGGFDRRVRLWDAESRDLVFEVELESDVVELAWSRDGRQMAVWPQGASVLILDATPR